MRKERERKIERKKERQKERRKERKKRAFFARAFFCDKKALSAG